MTRRAFLLYAVVVSALEELVLLAVLLVVLPAAGLHLPPWAVVALAVAMAVNSVVLTRVNLRAIVLRPAKSPDVGIQAQVVNVLDPRGYVRVGNELWPAVCESGMVDRGTKVTVVRMDGLRLVVEPVVDER